MVFIALIVNCGLASFRPQILVVYVSSLSLDNVSLVKHNVFKRNNFSKNTRIRIGAQNF